MLNWWVIAIGDYDQMLSIFCLLWLDQINLCFGCTWVLPSTLGELGLGVGGWSPVESW